MAPVHTTPPTRPHLLTFPPNSSTTWKPTFRYMSPWVCSHSSHHRDAGTGHCIHQPYIKTVIAKEEEFEWHLPEPFLQLHSFHLLWVVAHFIHAFQKSSSLFCYPGNLKGNCDSHGESSSVVQKSEVLFVSKAPDCHILLIWMECKILVVKTGEDTLCFFSIFPL